MFVCFNISCINVVLLQHTGGLIIFLLLSKEVKQTVIRLSFLGVQVASEAAHLKCVDYPFYGNQSWTPVYIHRSTDTCVKYNSGKSRSTDSTCNKVQVLKCTHKYKSKKHLFRAKLTEPFVTLL